MMNWTEALGFVTGAVSVWLAVRQNVWNWPIGIANNLFYIVIFAQSRLFADMSLQAFYIAISLWGIYQWRRGGNAQTGVAVTHISRAQIAILVPILIVGTTGAAAYLARINDSSPILDAFTTVASLIAQYLLARKFLENWYLWIAIDAVSIGLYTSRALYLTTALYLIYLVMCAIGARDWRRSVVA